MTSLRSLHFGSFLGVAPNIWIAGLVILIGTPLLHFTIVGRYAYAIGSNERTVRLCGVNVDRYKSLCYVISGITAGLAGAMMTSKLRGGRPIRTVQFDRHRRGSHRRHEFVWRRRHDHRS